MNSIKSHARSLVRLFDTRTPATVKSHFIKIGPKEKEHLRSYFLNLFLTQYENIDPVKHDHVQRYWRSTEGKEDLEEHVIGRIVRDRLEYVPWLNSIQPLQNSNILEIGCGTGSSAVALGEQGANLIGIDPVKIAISMSNERARVYGLRNLNFLNMNAMDIENKFDIGQFNFIIFFASLEHMTHRERLSSLRAAWNLLERGAFLAVVEAPNRLWFFDDHTSLMPFFHWLPDDLAREYLDRYAPQPATRIAEHDDDDEMVEFMRLGRGVSYHEFELALEDLSHLRIVSDRYSFQNKNNWLRWLYFRLSRKGRYSHFLKDVREDIHPGFLMPYLNIIIQKN